MRRITEIFKKFILDKKNRKIVILAAMGVFLLILGSAGQKDNVKENIEENYIINMENIRKKSESELEKFLQKIDGLSDISVMIAYKDSGTKSYSKNIKNSSSANGGSSDSSVVMQRKGGDEKPVEEKNILPEIKGVSIIARGRGEMSAVIARAVSAALGVEIHKIEVIVNEEK